MMHHQKRLIRPCISRFGFTNSSLSPYLSYQRIVLCRLRSSTSTSLIKDDDNNDEEEEANTSYVVKKVKSAPISSLFMGNNNRNNKQTASTTTTRRRRGRSRSDTRSEQQHYNGLNGSSSNSNSKKKISGSSLQHYFTRPSRIGNPTVYTTEAINTKIEEEESNSKNSILKQYIIQPVIRALQQFTSAIGFTNVTSNNTIMNSLLLPSTSRQRYHDINRSKRRYQCRECGYQVKRWTSLLSRMQHCAHCTTSVDTSSELDPKDFAVYLDDEDYNTTSSGKNSNNMSFEWRRINSYQNNLRQQQKKRKMTKEMKLERFRSNNGYVIPQMYRTPRNEEETVKAEAPISPKASSSSHQPKEIVERKHTGKIVKRRKKKLYQCEECGQTTKLWKHFRAMKRDCTLCDTRAGLKRTDFLRILNNIR